MRLHPIDDMQMLFRLMVLGGSLLFAAPFLHADDWRNQLVLPGFADNALHGEVLQDRPVLLQFWESWCRSCGQLMSDMDEVAVRFPSIRYLVVSTDEHAADARRRLESHPLFSQRPERFFHDAKQQLERRFDISTVPTVLVLGADGRERLRHVGHFNSSELSRLVSLLEELDSTSKGSSP